MVSHIPHHLLSRLMYKATRCSWRPWKNTLIRLFIHIYNVDLTLAEKSSAHEFETFNDFFTRSLKPAVRPITPVRDGLVSPVDASISALGTIDDNRIFQAKGKNYSLEDLLDGADDFTGRYRNGNFITLYLSPRDYHRIHIPADGELVSMSYIPGRLFSVNPATTDRINNLFARNERVVTTFSSATGMFSVIFIGAIFVGSMETVWHGQVTPAAGREHRVWNYEPGTVFKQGDEIGRFNMGSTVIVLTEPNYFNWCAGAEWVAMGQQIAVGIGNYELGITN